MGQFSLTSSGHEVVLDFLEVILDAAEVAAQPAGLDEEDPVTYAILFLLSHKTRRTGRIIHQF